MLTMEQASFMESDKIEILKVDKNNLIQTSFVTLIYFVE